MKLLRYVGSLEKTLIDVATLEYGKVIQVTDELAHHLLTALSAEYEELSADAEKAWHEAHDVIVKVEEDVKKVVGKKTAKTDESADADSAS